MKSFSLGVCVTPAMPSPEEIAFEVLAGRRFCVTHLFFYPAREDCARCTFDHQVWIPDGPLWQTALDGDVTTSGG